MGTVAYRTGRTEPRSSCLPQRICTPERPRQVLRIVCILQNLNAQLNFIEAGEKDSALKLRTALLKFGVLPENAVVLSPKLAVEFVPRALPPEKAAEIRRVLEKYAAVPPEKVK